MVIFLGLRPLKYQALGVVSTQLMLVLLSFSLNHQLSVSIIFFIVIFFCLRRFSPNKLLMGISLCKTQIWSYSSSGGVEG